MLLAPMVIVLSGGAGCGMRGSEERERKVCVEVGFGVPGSELWKPQWRMFFCHMVPEIGSRPIKAPRQSFNSRIHLLSLFRKRSSSFSTARHASSKEWTDRQSLMMTMM